MEEKKNTCPIHFHYHYTRRILFFGKYIGYMEWRTRGSKYIVIDKHKFRSIFLFSDVYCKECDVWHFV